MAIAAIVVTAGIWLHTQRKADRARMLAQAAVVNSTSNNMMQRTPENQVQQQGGDGEVTTNNEHEKSFLNRTSRSLGNFSKKVYTNPAASGNFRRTAKLCDGCDRGSQFNRVRMTLGFPN